MSRLAVDPAVLAVAGVGLIGVGEGLVPAVAALSAAFHANTGQDAAGVVFGRHYQDAGREIMTSVATGINALLRTGYGVQVSAVNYSRAEANSDLSRRAQPLDSPPCPADVSAPGAPSPLGGGVGEPALWAVVELLVGDLWPNGSPTQMRAAASAWRRFASVLYGVSGDVAGPYNTVAAQEIPEGEAVKKTIRDIEGVFGQLAMGCEGLATAVEGFATDVENTQNAIRRLLAKLGSIGSIVGIFFEFVRGHGEQELEQIAADIRTVMDHLKGEAAAKKAMMAQALSDFEALNQAMRIVADREFTEFFGEDVGSVLSGLWQAGGDIDRGIARWTASTVEGLEDLNPARAFYDPQGAWATWKGLAQMAQVVTNPAADPELTEEIAKGLLRVEEWKTQRPLTALTENALDIGTLFFGPEAAAGGVAKAGDLADVALAAGRADATTLTGVVGKAGEATRAASALDGITGRSAELARSLDKATTLPVEKPPALPVEKSPALPVTDKPAAVPVADKPPVGGGTPVSPDKPAGLPASPVESKPSAATAPHAKATDTPAALKPYGNDTAAATVGEHAPAPPATAETPRRTGTPGAAPGEHTGGALKQAQPGGPDGGEVPGAAANTAAQPDGSIPSERVAVATPGQPDSSTHSNSHTPAGSESAVTATAEHSIQHSVATPDHHGDGRLILHSSEPANEHWHHIPDGPDNPHYGETLDSPGPLPEPGPVTEFNRRTWDLFKNPDELYGHDVQGRPLTNEQYAERYRVLRPDGTSVWDVYPPNDGAVPGTRWSTSSIEEYLKRFGPDVDRIGEASGKYLGVMENGVPAFFEDRGLPMSSLDHSYYRFRFVGQLQPGWTIEVSEVAPAFGRDGGGMQLLVRDEDGAIQTIKRLIKEQVLEDLDGAIR